MVDTSQLIKSLHDLFRPDRIACFLDQEQEMNMIQSSNVRQNNLLSKLFKERTFFSKEMEFERSLLKRDRCLIRQDPGLMDLTRSDRIFFVASQTVLAFMLILLSLVEKDRKRGIWIAEEIIEEYNLVGYYSKRHPYNAVRYKLM